MINFVIISDTHIPARAKTLPPEVWSAVDAVDVVVHAGDWIDVPTLDELGARARRLIGVHGNNDGPELRRRLPEIAWAQIGGLRLAVVHDSGPAPGREQRCAAAFPATDVLVFGHSHIPWDSTAPSGLRLINPGSPTDRRRQPACTYLTAGVRAGKLIDVTLHRLPARRQVP
jgi:hypothetical protein